MIDINNRPVAKYDVSIEVFTKPTTASNDEIKELLQDIYKHAKVFETSIAQNGTRLLSFEIYGSLTSRATSVALHRLFLKVIELEGTAQFRSMDGALFVLDELSAGTEISHTTFNVEHYNANTNVK